jgi:predicted glycoside hydrolase/deacetylase ChbG (UPF0249 family)
MKYCIVNADDFGVTTAVNRGIVEAHRNGIVTSASLMVNRPGAAEAAELSRALPRLSVGLHVDLAKAQRGGDRVILARHEIAAQWRRFEALAGRQPTHLDAHYNAHRDPLLAPLFVSLAREKGVPLREHCNVRYFSCFYGRWGGESHPEQISVDALIAMLENELADGVTELSCHPGYASADLRSDYVAEREIELRTLCNSRVASALASAGVQLINYRDVAMLRGNLGGALLSCPE